MNRARHGAAWLMLSLALVFNAAQAEKADRDKPTLIDSDRLEYDDAAQRNVFIGNVVLTKGTLILRADRLELRQDAQGNQFGVATAKPGGRVYLRQKREAVDEYIEGVSDRLEYDGMRERITFIGHAVLRRLACDRPLDEVRGERVIYDQRTDTYSANGGPQAATPNNRVRTLIQPHSSNNAAAVAAPAPCVNGPAQALTPSSSLSSDSP